MDRDSLGRRRQSVEAAPTFVVIPFPSGLCAVIAKEARWAPEFTPRGLQQAAWVAYGKADTRDRRIALKPAASITEFVGSAGQHARH